LLKESGKDLPFILVSGTIGEDIAVEAMRRGAHDYIMKDNLARLAPAVRRELSDAQLRRESKQVEKELGEYQKKLKRLTSRLSLAEEEERRRIAVGLHDRVGQTLAVSQLKLAELRGSSKTQSEKDSIDEVRDLIQEVIHDTRSLVFEISPPFLYDLGIEAALEWLTERFTMQHGIVCGFRDDNIPKPVGEDESIILFQAVRELLFNVSKHASAKKVEVCIRKNDDDLVLTVEDDGKGFEVSQTDLFMGKEPGFGLFDINEKVNSLGGNFIIESKPGVLTRVVLSVPLKKEL